MYCAHTHKCSVGKLHELVSDNTMRVEYAPTLTHRRDGFTKAMPPAKFLACLRDASSAIRSRAEYLPEVRTHVEMANRFDMLLDLIIIGETMEDRVPGRVY